MKSKYLKIICENCEQVILISYTANRHTLARRIDFAVCVYCFKPHNPVLFNRYINSWHCEDCHVPEPYVIRKGRQCLTCYMTEYRVTKTQKIL